MVGMSVVPVSAWAVCASLRWWSCGVSHHSVASAEARAGLRHFVSTFLHPSVCAMMFRRASPATVLVAVGLALGGCFAWPLVLPATFVAAESALLCKQAAGQTLRSTSRMSRLRTKAAPLLTLSAGGLGHWRAAVGGLASLGSVLGLVLGLRLKRPARKNMEKTQPTSARTGICGQCLLGEESQIGSKAQKVVRAGLQKEHLTEDAVFVLLTKEYNQQLSKGGREFRELRGKLRAAAPSYEKLVVLVLDPELKDTSSWSPCLPAYLQDRWVDLSGLDWEKPERTLRASEDLVGGIQFAKHLLKTALEAETGMKRVLFVGPTGAGKSLGAGAVLGNYKAFQASAGAASKTKGIQTAKSLVHKVELTDSEGVGDTSITDIWSFLRGSKSLIDSLLKLMKETPKGFHMVAYVARMGRFGVLDAKIASFLKEYVFVSESMNVCLIITHASELLPMSEEEKAAWLQKQVEENQLFSKLYDVVDRDPQRVVFVNNVEPNSACRAARKKADREGGWFDSVSEEQVWQSTVDENEYGMLRLREMIREADKPAKPSSEAIRKLMSQMAQAAVEEVNPAKRIGDLLQDISKEQKLRSDAEARAQANATSGSSGSSSDSDGCFGGDCEVVVKGRGTVLMSELACGDVVLGEGGWCRVVTWLHRCPMETCKMWMISTTTGVVHATGDHLIFLQDGSAMPARQLRVSQQLATTLGPGVVLRIEQYDALGYYAPLTDTGRIVISGTVCSCYVQNRFGFSHDVMHAAMLPLRLASAGMLRTHSHVQSPQTGLHWYAEWLVRVCEFACRLNSRVGLLPPLCRPGIQS
ncbi:hh [Symbiodinium sp. CCMP2592]|nr:hh [Symbiodinium sp. CCMP2592]